LKERTSGKEGHIQTNAAGKRVDFSARSVIVGSGPLCPVGTIGLPEYIAKKLTVPEPVTSWNKEYLTSLLEQGKITTVIRQGFTINVKKITDNFSKPFVWKNMSGLLLYDIVERQVKDGDVGIINRQPTLRIESMQGVIIKIMKGEYAIRLSLPQTRPFNADKPFLITILGIKK
jgi:DNA-directed RNA polymerase beta' subunit